MSYSSLENYYKTNFALIQHHKYSMSDINSLFPFERDLYVDMLNDYIKNIEEENSRNI